MKVILPWAADPKNTSATSLNLVDYPYLASTKRGVSHMLSVEEIIMRLEAAISDKDWAAVELLLEDLRVTDEDISQWSEGWDN
jgi:hypothetical protein